MFPPPPALNQIILKVNFKIVKSYHIKKLHKHLNFCDKFDFKDQGQGHKFQTRLKPLDDQYTVQVEG